MNAIPYAAIDTLFLDAGNTLICMNYEWIAAELRALGPEVAADVLRRAEAAARPTTSARIADACGRDDRSLFEFHLAEMLAYAFREGGGRAHALAIAPVLAARLKAPGEDYRLWSWVLPGVPEALRRLRALGLRLAVVSNSDGSVERALTQLGLARDVDAVFDSHVVGFEKPDPRFFAHALEQLGASAARTAHVGDMYYQDVQGSRSAGLHSVLLDPFGDWRVDDCVRHRDLAALAATMESVRAPR